MNKLRIPAIARIFAILLVVFYASNSSVYAQTEYMVDFDRAANSFNKINNIPGVNWIDPKNNAYDKKHHRYFFCGSADTKNWRLYTIDAQNGNVIASPAFLKFTDPQDNINDIQYCEKEDVLYAVYWEKATQTQHLIRVNYMTGTYSIVSSLPAVKYIQLDPMIDEENQLYMFSGYDTGLHVRLFSIDMSNGNVVYQPLVPSNHAQLRYDPSSGKVYGVFTDTNLVNHIISIDRVTGDVDTIATPADKYVVAGAFFFTYNERDHEYIFVTQDSNKHNHLLTVDVLTEREIYNTDFNLARNDSDNMVCFQYDNNLNRFFAIHWEAHSDKVPANGFRLYPNPYLTETNIVFDRACKKVAVLLYDASGKLISRRLYENTAHIVLDRKNLAAGVYFAVIDADDVLMDAVKLIAR